MRQTARSLCMVALALWLASSGALAATPVPVPGEWTEQGKVLDIGGSGQWDDFGCFYVTSALKVTGEAHPYYLFYTGSDGPRQSDGDCANRKIGVAYSDDGVNFTKSASNPIITLEDENGQCCNVARGGINDEEEGALFATVFHDGATFHMYWEAAIGVSSTGVKGEIHYATSGDGETWTYVGLILAHTDVVGGCADDEVWPVGVLNAQGGTTQHTGDVHVWFASNCWRGQTEIGLLTGSSPGTLNQQSNFNPIVATTGNDQALWAWSVPVVHTDGTVSLFYCEDPTGWSGADDSQDCHIFQSDIDVLQTITNSGNGRYDTGCDCHYNTGALFRDGDTWRLYYTAWQAQFDGQIDLRTAAAAAAPQASVVAILKTLFQIMLVAVPAWERRAWLARQARTARRRARELLEFARAACRPDDVCEEEHGQVHNPQERIDWRPAGAWLFGYDRRASGGFAESGRPRRMEDAARLRDL